MVTLSLNFMILYRRQFGARVSPLACWRCLPLAQFGALFPSFLPSSCWMARCGDRDNHQHSDVHRDNHEHADVVFPLGFRGCVFLGGWGFFPSPQVGVWTRCLLIQILSMNLEQKSMALVASGVRDRRQKIEWVWGWGW